MTCWAYTAAWTRRLHQSDVRLRCRDYLGAFGEMACDWVVLSPVDEFGFLLGADGLGFPAAGTEPATTRRAQSARDVAGQQDPGTMPLDVWVGHWHCGKQRLRVGVRGPLIYLGLLAHLDNLAKVHDRDAVGDVPHDR